MFILWNQIAIGILGCLHAAATYFYFSRVRFAKLGASVWLGFTAGCIWGLPQFTQHIDGVFFGTILAWTIWWVSIRPLSSRTWVPEDSHQATGYIEGERLCIQNRRHFAWRSKTEFTAQWDDAVYDLGALEAVDLFLSTWGDPRVAHAIISFVFRDNIALAFSIETRRETTERWSTLAGFMKSYELIIIAAPETDLIRVRTNIRREKVRRYRLKSTPMMRRRLLANYLFEMNSLARRPRFYNTLFSNCTTEVARILTAAGRPVPLSWPLIVSGYVPAYFHQIGLLDPERALVDIEAEADIGEQARNETSNVEFSTRIRTLPQRHTTAASHLSH